MRTQQQQQQNHHQQQHHQQQHHQQQQQHQQSQYQQPYHQQFAPSPSLVNSKTLGLESHHLDTYDIRPPAPLLTQTKNQNPIDQLNRGHFVSQDNHISNFALPTGLVNSRRLKEREELSTFQKPTPVAKGPTPGLTVRELKELTRLRLQQSQKGNNNNYNDERLSGGETSGESDIQSISTNMLSRSGTSTPDTDSLFDDGELSANNIHGYPFASMLGSNSDFRTVGHTPSSLPKSAAIPPGLGIKSHLSADMPLSYNNDIGIGMLRQSAFNNPSNDLSSFINDRKNIDGLFDTFNDNNIKHSLIPNASLPLTSQTRPQNNTLRKQAISNAFRESPYVEDGGHSLSKIFGNDPLSIGASHFPSPLIAPPLRARANSQTSVDSPPGSPKTLRNSQQLPSNISCPEVVRKRTSSDCSLSLDIAEKMALSVIDASGTSSSPITGQKGKGSFDNFSNLSDSNFLGKNISNDFAADLYR